jgi:nuclear pore complex protein Nup210
MCESRVAEVTKIEILTKLRVIDVDDFQVFELIGYDSQGNAFTSLEGLRFQWQIKQQSHLAAFVSFDESSIKTTNTRHAIEKAHSQSDMVVMKGIQTGVVEVSVLIKEPGYEVISLSY